MEKENNLMEESENRLIELILSRTNISEEDKLIKSLINKGVSERLLKKFLQRLGRKIEDYWKILDKMKNK